MNKFTKGLLTMSLTALCMGGLVACNTTDPALEEAKTYLYRVYKDELVNTDDYKLPAKVIINNVEFPVTWTANVTSGNAEHVVIGTEVKGGFYTVDVVYDPLLSTADVEYTLTATISNADGKTVTQEFTRSIPQFKFTSHSDYLKAKDDSMINVEGYVVGAYPLYNGTTQVFIQTANGEGYYIYKLPVEEAAFATDMAVGNYIIVSGVKDTYNGTAEIVNPTYQLSNKADVTVEPYDVTSIFDAAEKVNDPSLVNLQGSLVTVKGVTITTVGSNGYLNWTKGGKDSYVRISSSGNVSDADPNAKKTLEDTVKNYFGYTADVTGIVSQYNGNFYLMPTSADSIKVTSTSMDAEFAFDYAVAQLSVAESIFSDLPTTVEGTGTTITWASSVAGLVSENGKVTPANEPTTTTLTATITLGTKSETKVFENVVVKLPEPSPVKTINAAIAGLGDAKATGVFVVEGTIVAKDGSGRPYVMDSHGDVILVYNNKVDEVKNAPIGTKIKVAGTGSIYNGLYQFGYDLDTFKALEVGTTTSEVVYGNAEAYTAEEYVAAVLTNKDQTMNGKYVKLTGVTLTKSGNYYNLAYGTDGEIQLQAKNIAGCNETNVGQEVVVYGYSYGTNGTIARIAAVDVKLASEDVDAPVITTESSEITSEALGLSNVYADSTATVDGITLALTQCSDYGDGIQMRYKNGVKSSVANTVAFGTGITEVKLIWSTTKANGHDNEKMMMVEFSNSADFSDAEVHYVDTVKNGTEYVVTPSVTTYTYVRITNNQSYSTYWSAFEVSYNLE